jgi:TonB family protein
LRPRSVRLPPPPFRRARWRAFSAGSIRPRSRVAGVAAPLAARHDPGRAALLTLTLAADGTLKAVDLDRSSGSAAFDRGLRESVQRATPFPPLPETIRKQADLLVVTLQLPER